MGGENSGRRKGVPNKRTVEVQAMLEALGCNPIQGMYEVAQQALKGYCVGVDEDNKPIIKQDYALAGQMYKELAQYIAPKRKAIEHTGNDGNAIEMALQTSFNVQPIAPKQWQD